MWSIRARIGQVFGDVDDALQFVHCFDAADAFDFTNGEGRPAFAGGAKVAARRRMERCESEPVLREGAGHRLHFCLGGVIEVASRGKNFQGLEASLGNLPEKFGGQTSRHKQVGG